MGETYNDGMSLKEALMFLKDHLAKDWRDVGRHLGLLEADFDNITSDNLLNSKEAHYQMLLKWQRMKGSDATVSVLAAALRNSGRNDLVDKIEGRRSSLFSNVSQARTPSSKEDERTPDVRRRQESSTISGKFIWYFLVPTAVAIFFLGCLVSLNMFDSDGIQRVKRDEMEEIRDDSLESDQLGTAIVYVKKILAKDWQEVGRSLKLSDAELEHINEEYSNNPKERNYHMLRKWREKYGKQATLETLSDALRKAGRNDLADDLPKGTRKEKKRK